MPRRLYYILVTATFLYFFYLCLNSILIWNGAGHSMHYNNDLPIQRKSPIIWRTLEEVNRTNDPSANCRNSVQGRDLLVDERGFVCLRSHLYVNGCCDVERFETVYCSCNTCNISTHCCKVYEYCVSCCLQPTKRPLLEEALQKITGRQAIVYAAVEDQFQLCLVKCRTSSHSVVHENKYKNPNSKYCYGPTEAQIPVNKTPLT